MPTVEFSGPEGKSPRRHALAIGKQREITEKLIKSTKLPSSHNNKINMTIGPKALFLFWFVVFCFYV